MTPYISLKDLQPLLVCMILKVINILTNKILISGKAHEMGCNYIVVYWLHVFWDNFDKKKQDFWYIVSVDCHLPI